MTELRYIRDVATLNMNADLCSGCLACTEVCPHAVFAASDGHVRIADRDACMECGACSLNCPEGAIELTPGVGCAAAIIRGWLTGGEPSCDCS